MRLRSRRWRNADDEDQSRKFRGSIILLHDGGGDRSVDRGCVAGADQDAARHGYTIVPVSALMGKTTAQVSAAAHFLATPALHSDPLLFRRDIVRPTSS